MHYYSLNYFRLVDTYFLLYTSLLYYFCVVFGDFSAEVFSHFSCFCAPVTQFDTASGKNVCVVCIICGNNHPADRCLKIIVAIGVCETQCHNVRK